MNDTITQIAEQYYHSVYYYCVSKLGDSEAAKDCTQEVFLVLVKKQHELHDLAHIRPWLYRTADLAVREYRRKNLRYLPTTDEELERLSETVLPDLDDDRLRKMLSAADYALLWSYYIEGYSVRELAAQAGISENAAYQRLSRLRKRIAEEMTAEERGDAQ